MVNEASQTLHLKGFTPVRERDERESQEEVGILKIN